MCESSETRGKVKVEKSEYNIIIPTVGKVLVQWEMVYGLGVLSISI